MQHLKKPEPELSCLNKDYEQTPIEKGMVQGATKFNEFFPKRKHIDNNYNITSIDTNRGPFFNPGLTDEILGDP